MSSSSCARKTSWESSKDSNDHLMQNFAALERHPLEAASKAGDREGLEIGVNHRKKISSESNAETVTLGTSTTLLTRRSTATLQST